MKNLENKIQALNANRGEISLYEYVNAESQSDPNFFRWLFDEEFDNDFDSSMSDDQKAEFNTWLEEIRVEELFEKYIVVNMKNVDEDEICITKREHFENVNMCDCYANYGNKIGCYDAGCYSFNNSASSIFEDFYEEISDRFGIGSLMDDNELTTPDLVELLKSKDDTDIFPAFGKMVEFFIKWREENETHTEVTAWTYHDSHNFTTVFLDTDFGEPDCIELEEDEQISILAEYPGFPYIKGTNTRVKTANYIFHFDLWATNPWVCYVENK